MKEGKTEDPVARRRWPRKLDLVVNLLALVLVVEILAYGKFILLPVALAIYASFLLEPIVKRVQRHLRLHRVAAVFFVFTAATGVLGLIAWTSTTQVIALAQDIPLYRRNIVEKYAAFAGLTGGGKLDEIKETINQAVQEGKEKAKSDQIRKNQEAADESQPAAFSPGESDGAGMVAGQDERGDARPLESLSEPATGESSPANAAPETEPVPVKVVVAEEIIPELKLGENLGSLISPIGTTGLVLLLSIIFLITREDLRNRIVAVAGRTRLAVTTKALNEASERISRFLLMQFAVNASYGIAVGVGLYLFEVPFPAVWGLSAFLLRYVPYIGPLVAAIVPILVSLIVMPGWQKPVMVIGFYIVLELVSNNVLEPWLYGKSGGISAAAVLVMAVFWAWMWGPIGLILSMPIAVVLVVLGQYVPSLSVLSQLMGTNPVTELYLRFYQRLLSYDDDDTLQFLWRQLETKSPNEVCEKLLVPVLLQAAHDLARGDLDPKDAKRIAISVGELANSELQEASSSTVSSGKVKVLAIPPGNDLEEAALVVLDVYLGERFEIEIIDAKSLVSETSDYIRESRPAVTLAIAFTPGNLWQLKAWGKRLRARSSDLRLIAGWWRPDASDISKRSLKTAGYDDVALSIRETKNALVAHTAQPVAPASTESISVPAPDSGR